MNLRLLLIGLLLGYATTRATQIAMVRTYNNCVAKVTASDDIHEILEGVGKCEPSKLLMNLFFLN